MGMSPPRTDCDSKAVVKDENSLQRESCQVSPLQVCVCVCVRARTWRQVWGVPRMREEGRASCHRKLTYQLTRPQQDAGHGIAHSPDTEPSAWTLSGLPGRTQGLRVNPRPGKEQKRTLG